MVVEAFAKAEGWQLKGGLFKKDLEVSGMYGGRKLFLLLPMTYMNLSGSAVKKFTDYRKIPLTNLMVVVDDADLPFGTARMREAGSSGGHNGLKSIEKALGSQEYPRLRMGIKNGMLEKQSLESYVLEKFSKEEQQKLPEQIEHGVHLLRLWLDKGMEVAMREVNKR
ncbi:MAG: Peptidyl-tRNA hydrolase [Chlamydiales bacterium]|nr:Peptidyl-tRNA hydrolase [Chlamydiales bacterium]MCH9622483.1 Peptidyl-tRNA hydrolase [Chlamydiales bacterium]